MAQGTDGRPACLSSDRNSELQLRVGFSLLLPKLMATVAKAHSITESVAFLSWRHYGFARATVCLVESR